MKIPLSWLKEFVDIDVSAEELERLLFARGFEVEETVRLGKDVEKIVVGNILSVEKHPDADRLTVCKTDCGGYGVKQICTAATNVFAGALVPVALDGATVLSQEGARKIKTGKLRGVLSEGMFCSGEELGIDDDFFPGASVNGILILPPASAVGADVKTVVGLDDVIFDIAVTANRPDCQSVVGIAREVAAILKKPFKMCALDYPEAETAEKIGVRVEDAALCPRYIGQYVKDVSIAPSPAWMRHRLALMDIRSISNVVDITNYVLCEMGQPMHAFDRATLRGDEIVVRRARTGEKIVTLDKKEFTLTPENLLICDGEGPVALAGIMGGLNSEIGADTREVFFEAASFARDNVRKTSRALGQRSDSSSRFEKGVDFFTPEVAMRRALHLVWELGCGTPTAYRADVYARVPAPRTVRLTCADVDAILGIRVPEEEIRAILTRLGFGVEGEETMTVTAPPFREDIDGKADIAEEVIRSYGYEHIVPTFLKTAHVTHGGLTPEQEQENKFKQTLLNEGYFEALGYSFYSPKDLDLLRLPPDAEERRAVTLRNPIGEDLSIMRTILVPTMIANVVRNVRRGNESGRLFELANVYRAETLPPVELPAENKHVCIALWGEGDFFDLKGAVEAIAEAFSLDLAFRAGEKPFLHPGATATVLLNGKEVGFLGELHPSIAAGLTLEKKTFLCELDYGALKRKFRKDVTYLPIPKFPAVKRDLAVVVAEERTCDEVRACILRACKAVKRADLFDVYRDFRIGKGKKSMAFRLTFAAGDKGLTPEAADVLFQKIVLSLKAELGAELR